MLLLTEDVARGARRFHASGRPISRDVANEIAARAMLRDRRAIQRAAARAKALLLLRQVGSAIRGGRPAVPWIARAGLAPRQRS